MTRVPKFLRALRGARVPHRDPAPWVRPLMLPRLVTIHPILVHVTLGVLPVIVLAYTMAAARRSARWSFAGDVALWVGATFTLGTAAFGLVSNAMLKWPGGLSPWRWWHLGLALASSTLLLALAGWRARAHARGEIARGGTLFASAVVALLYLATGWLGGEVLAYRAGMAVEAAGLGALAPLASGRGSGSAPRDVPDDMARLRGSWAIASTRIGKMLVQQPSAREYDEVAKAAIDIQAMSKWLGEEGAREIATAERHEAREPPHTAAPGQARAAPAGGGEARTAQEHGEQNPDETVRQAALELSRHANALERAARQREWTGVTEALSAVTNDCARCHENVRWKHDAKP